MEYAAPLLITSEHNVSRLSKIQSKALRIIYKKPNTFSATALNTFNNLEPIDLRLKNLAKNYFNKAIAADNPLINELIENNLNH